MQLDYKKSESTIRPSIVDTESSNNAVYLRKNIKETDRLTMDGKCQVVYEYDEAKLTNAEYEQYLKELSLVDIQQQRADIDYIALMLDVFLDEV